MRAPEAVLFDLDNTLVDRGRSIMIYAMLFCRDFRARLRDVDPAVVIRTLKREDGGGYAVRSEFFGAVARALPWIESPAADDLARHWREHFPGCAVPVRQATDVLRELRGLGLKTGVVTNGWTSSQNAKIDAAGVRPLLDTVVISQAAGVAKPSPEIFQRALQGVGVPASKAWFVGDHPANDVEGAVATGMTAVWIEGLHAWPEGRPRPEASIFSLGALPAMIRAAREAAAG